MDIQACFVAYPPEFLLGIEGGPYRLDYHGQSFISDDHRNLKKSGARRYNFTTAVPAIKLLNQTWSASGMMDGRDSGPME